MELREFVKTTLVEIIGGVEDARKEIEKEGSNAYVAPITKNMGRNDPTAVAFDVAVTATESADGKAEAGIKVWALRLGASGGISTGSESVSRIQFSVPIALPGRRPQQDLDKAERDRKKSEEDRAAQDARIEAHNRSAAQRRI